MYILTGPSIPVGNSEKKLKKVNESGWSLIDVILVYEICMVRLRKKSLKKIMGLYNYWN